MSKTSKWIKGSEYDRLLADFIDRGGDLSLCPFETSGYRWEEPPHARLGSDSDGDSLLDEVWSEIQKNGFKSESPTDEDWALWESERNS